MDYFKVVRVHKGKLYSIAVRGPLSLEYVPDEWAEAKRKFLDIGYGLFVFGSKDAAMDFMFDYRERQRLEVWECKIGKSFHLPFIRKIILEKAYQGKDLKPRWRVRDCSINDSGWGRHDWPKETLVTDKVMLTKLVFS